jgi:hypothetical protein
MAENGSLFLVEYTGCAKDNQSKNSKYRGSIFPGWAVKIYKKILRTKIEGGKKAVSHEL